MITGRLDQFVRVEAPTETGGQLGEPRDGWAFFANAWAAIDALSGEELVRAQAIESRAALRVQMWCLPGLTTKHRIVWGTRVLHISAVRDWRSAGVEHLVDCYEVEGERP